MSTSLVMSVVNLELLGYDGTAWNAMITTCVPNVT
jgi:hypothetical protein